MDIRQHQYLCGFERDEAAPEVHTLRERNKTNPFISLLMLPSRSISRDRGLPQKCPFTCVRWIGDRKGIEEQTTRWDQVILDREREMQKWIRLFRQLLQRGARTLGFFNNHYAGCAPGSVKLLRNCGRSSSAMTTEQMGQEQLCLGNQPIKDICERRSMCPLPMSFARHFTGCFIAYSEWLPLC